PHPAFPPTLASTRSWQPPARAYTLIPENWSAAYSISGYGWVGQFLPTNQGERSCIFADAPCRSIVTGSEIPPWRPFMPAIPLGKLAVHLRPEDNVAVAARDLAAGTEMQVNGTTLAISGRIGMGHKISLRPIKKGEAVLKYGQVIGFARQDIPAGSHVH